MKARQGTLRTGGALLALAGTALLAGCHRGELVALETIAPSVRQQMRYAGSANFVGAPIDGYRAPRCWLAEPAARALAGAQAEAAAEGLTLLVYDCYRPKRAVRHFVRWAASDDQATKEDYYPRVSKRELLLHGYVAEPSAHSRGSTVDVTLARPCNGGVVPLDMGTRHDFFDPSAHYASTEVTPLQRANRRRLRELMERHGFRAYDAEWWHFTLADEPYPDRQFDVPIE
ncbi:MAG TPA: M15 family metallopeptidase [Candidatus Limnocylindria bacterium]|nr:M15 family metallopeptidase [Candidatus Limnocylindria bacterium]